MLERHNVQKCMNVHEGGTQTPQLNDSFASNVRLRLRYCQKEQPPESFYKKCVVKKVLQNSRKNMLEFLFNKDVDFQAYNFIKKSSNSDVLL